MILDKLNRLLNLSNNEWPRVMVAWLLVFFSRIGFILGGTILTAVFLSRVGIDLLPGLFLINAVFMMVGTLIYRRWIHKLSRELLITTTVLAAAAFLIVSIFFLERDTSTFLVLFLIAQAVLLAQLNILVSLFNEELFSPLESQRTFPVIESAETLGGIVGGLALTLFAIEVPTYKLIIVWVLILLSILPIVLLFNPRTMEVPKLGEEAHEAPRKKFTEHFAEVRKIPFLKALMVVIALHWALINVVEFQYTKAIQQDVYSMPEATLVEHDDGVVLAEEDLVEEEHYQQELTQKLGTLHLIFNSAALFMQLIFTSRILTFLGITSSMLLHPIVTLFNLAWMTLRFNFLSASMTRGSFELTNIIFKNAYDSSYYAIPHHMRSDIKELMQGIMKPFGAIMGTIGMILVAFLLEGNQETFALNIGLILMSGIMAFVLAGIGRKYTQMSEQNLSHKLDLPTRLNAIEILAQKGHEKNTADLQKILKRDTEPEVLKESILHTFGVQEDLESIGSILDMLHNRDEHLRLAAAQALGQFANLKEHMMNQAFTRFRVLETLKERLEKEENESIREEMLSIFHNLAPDLLTEFLVAHLEKESTNKASFIRMLRMFHDCNLRFYLEKYLDSKDSTIRASAIISLWQFKSLHKELMHHLTQMLASNKENVLCAGIEACGQVKEYSLKKVLKDHLKHGSENVQKTALIALAQMEDTETITPLVEALTDPAHEWFEKTFMLLARFSKNFKRTLQNALHLKASERISIILSKEKGKHLEAMQPAHLYALHGLYSKMNAHHEAHRIKKVLDSKDSGSL